MDLVHGLWTMSSGRSIMDSLAGAVAEVTDE
jgi:hypothetical protein